MAEKELKSVIHFDVDERWMVVDVEKFSSAILFLYKLGMLIDFIERSYRGKREGNFWLDKLYRENEPLNTEHLDFLLDNYYYPKTEIEYAQLEVLQVKYSSPGVVDLVGLGVVVGHIKEFILKTIEIAVESEKRKLENQLKEEEIQKKRIENAFEYLKLLKECGYTQDEIKPLALTIDEKQNTVFELALQGKVKDVELMSYSKFKKA